ncbi:MAG: hypothetical protein Hals2KO_24380 [Halioglobus sp.]
MTASGTAGETRGISVVMPVYNGVDFIGLSLPPLIAMLQRDEIAEVLVVDDGSTDNTVQMAQKLGARVLDSGGRLGPGGARNRAAEQALGDILWFVDADVVVHDDAALAIRASFDDEGVVAVFGSYDDRPPGQNFFSQYKNLVHHYYHQRAKEEASTFWSGCGAVRKDAFQAVGGFDIERYRYPSIEDIELGNRLIGAGGRIRMNRAVQCTHLKIWRLWNLLHTEIFRRAIPWSRLILTDSNVPDDLNTSKAEQMRAGLAGLFFLSVFVAALQIFPFYIPLAVAALVVVLNRELLRLFYARKGLLFALGGLLFHQVYYVYSATAFVAVALEVGLRKLTGNVNS